jgi:hypothetical protein
MSSLFQHSSGLVSLGGGESGPEGKSDDYADWHSRALESGDGGLDPDGVDHGAGEAVFGCFMAELKDLIAAGVRLKECVIEDSGKILRRRESVSGESIGVECIYFQV